MNIRIAWLLIILLKTAIAYLRSKKLTPIPPYTNALDPPSFIGLCPLLNPESIAKPRNFKILTIDGGGVRGIIPLRLLVELERRSDKPISELFDLMVGNSAGGLLVIGLNTPNENNKPKYNATDLLNFYLKESKKIFNASILWNIKTGYGLWGPKYDRTAYDKLLEDYFKEIRMSQLIKPTTVVSYNIDTSLPSIWSRKFARQNPEQDFYIRDIIAATTAAPTYFSPKMLIDKNHTKRYEVDGGVYANNPEDIAVYAAYQLNNKISPEDTIIVSLGTGSAKLNFNADKLKNAGIVGWFLKANLLDIMVSAKDDWCNTEIGTKYSKSCRFQIPLDNKMSKMDDASIKHMNALLNLIEEYVDANSEIIDKLVKIINEQSINEPKSIQVAEIATTLQNNINAFTFDTLMAGTSNSPTDIDNETYADFPFSYLINSTL